MTAQIFVTAFLLVVVPVLVTSRRHRPLFLISLFSIMTDIAFVGIGQFQFKAVSYVAFCYTLASPRIFFDFSSRFLKTFWLELGLVTVIGLYFVLVSPWPDEFSSVRTATQRLPLRTAVGIVRQLEQIATFAYSYFVFRNNFLTRDFFVRTTARVTGVVCLVGVLDYTITNGWVRRLFIPNHLALMRFTGLSGEPRGVAQHLTVVLFVMVSWGVRSAKPATSALAKRTIVICVAGIVLAFSSTGIGLLVITLAIYSSLGQVRPKHVVFAVLLIVGGYSILNLDPGFREHQNQRIEMVTLKKTRFYDSDVPIVFNALEVFDKAAAVFLFKNPIYSLVGVGPNTVTIPATRYLSGASKTDFGGRIDSAPGTFPVNVIARTGLLGFGLYLWLFKRTALELRARGVKKDFQLFLLLTIYNFFYISVFWYLLSGVLLGASTASRWTKSSGPRSRSKSVEKEMKTDIRSELIPLRPFIYDN
jgi:hypothetical protein